MGRLAPHPPAPPQQSQSKAGRNLPAAILTALLLAAVVIATIFIVIEAFVVLVGVFMLLAVWEVCGAFKARHIEVPILPLWIGVIGICLSTWIHGEIGLLLSVFLTSALLTGWRLTGDSTFAGRDALAGVFGISWIGLLGGFMILLAAHDKGAFAVLTAILLPVMNDTGGYAAGIFLGKTPMAPTISPKKSWEGFGGSLLLTAVVAVLCVVFGLGLSWWWGIVLGIACTVAATCGDLAESLLKRDLGVKDMGTIFPGHGGALDRVDSILVCAPVVYSILVLAS